VYYGTLIDLITSLEEAQAAGQLKRRLAVLTHPSLLVVDEIGYLPINHAGAVLFFQLMNRRYNCASAKSHARPRFGYRRPSMGSIEDCRLALSGQRRNRVRAGTCLIQAIGLAVVNHEKPQFRF
jgi:IstB-like ATP binding protein